LALASPVSVSAKAEPITCSMPVSVSPAASPPETAPVARLTETPAAEPA
jgi:hypothetical protein